MIILRLTVVLILAALVNTATAQIVPPPFNATVINFDEVFTDTCTPAGPVTTEYVSKGITFSGFGQSGGAIIPEMCNYGFPAVSPPNFLGFASIIVFPSGGIEQSPETLTFYPPVLSFQFDTFTLADFCEGTMVLFVNAFAPGGALVGSTSLVLSSPVTVAFTFPPPGAERVVVSSTHTCGSSLFKGVEVFTMDNIAFVSLPSPASRCAQAQLDAAGKKAKAVATCYAKAVQNGVEVDTTCLQKASDAFAKSFTKAQGMGDCLTDADEGSAEGAVDTFVASAVQTITGGAPGPDICANKKLVAAGKKAQSVAKCYSNGAKKGVVADPACIGKAAKSFTSSLKKCGTQPQIDPIEFLVDQFANSLARTLTVPTTSTTTTTTSTTTTTTAPPLGQHLSFTTTVGTANCGSSGLSTPADPPFSGELDSNTAGTMKIADLGLGCLYIGGGAGTIPASIVPENATTILDSPDGTSLLASFGTGPRDCSRGPQATSHCANDPTVACTDDTECGGQPGACLADPSCFFGPPVPVNGFPPSCVVNSFAADANGTLDLATGASSVSIALASRVFLTLGQPTTCPQCVDGACNYGANTGGACATENSALTSLDCLPSPGTFVATLPVDLTPLTSGANIVTAADGIFCTGQTGAGAFGVPTTQAIAQMGTPSGDLTDGLPHPSVLVSNFCIPMTGNIALDNLANLPGPGSLSLSGNAQFVASPSGAFLN